MMTRSGVGTIRTTDRPAGITSRGNNAERQTFAETHARWSPSSMFHLAAPKARMNPESPAGSRLDTH